MSFMTEKEALIWKQTYLQSITNEEGNLTPNDQELYRIPKPILQTH